MSNFKYDVIVLGGGPGGYVAAIKSSQKGLKTALIEKSFIGGTCLNIGCIPTKALLSSAEAWASIRSMRDFGITIEGASFDFTKIMSRKDRVVKQLRGGVEFLMKKNAIDVYNGTGKLSGANSITVNDEEELTSEYIIIATGSEPSRPPIPGLNGVNVATSNEMLKLEKLPESMIVIGGGAIGIEFAYLCNTLGTKVTLLEGLEHILPQEDEQIAAELTAALKKKGIDVIANAMVKEIADAPEGKSVSFNIKGEEDNNQIKTAELVLVATGRTPVTENCGFAENGITIERRAIKVDANMYTGVAGIYAIGDVTGGMLLAHKASAEAAVAVENIAGIKTEMSYRAIPTALYSHPQVASVGMTEATALAAGIDAKSAVFPFRAIGKAIAIGEREGNVKIVIDNADNKLLGCQAIGPHVTDMITGITLAIENGMTVNEYAKSVHAHPTLSEIFHEASEAVMGHPVHI
jgi:dihydrolipoamide dehydrogenase